MPYSKTVYCCNICNTSYDTEDRACICEKRPNTGFEDKFSPNEKVTVYCEEWTDHMYAYEDKEIVYIGHRVTYTEGIDNSPQHLKIHIGKVLLDPNDPESILFIREFYRYFDGKLVSPKELVYKKEYLQELINTDKSFKLE